jgi:hypothetical protein
LAQLAPAYFWQVQHLPETNTKDKGTIMIKLLNQLFDIAKDWLKFEFQTKDGSKHSKFYINATVITDEKFAQILPFHGKSLQMADGITRTLECEPKGTAYVTKLGLQKFTESHKIQLVPDTRTPESNMLNMLGSEV